MQKKLWVFDLCLWSTTSMIQVEMLYRSHLTDFKCQCLTSNSLTFCLFCFSITYKEHYFLYFTNNVALYFRCKFLNSKYQRIMSRLLMFSTSNIGFIFHLKIHNQIKQWSIQPNYFDLNLFSIFKIKIDDLNPSQ